MSEATCVLCRKRPSITNNNICIECDYAASKEIISILEARIKELKEKLSLYEWRDIKDAPKDGFHILLYRPEIIFSGYWSEAGWVIKAPDLPIMDPPPTHWMHEPTPPSTQEGEE